MSELKGIFPKFLNLNGKEKKKKIAAVSGQVSSEVLKRLSAYKEVNQDLRARYKMSYEDFRKSGRSRLRLTFHEHKMVCDLWRPIQEGMESLDKLYLEMSRGAKNA